MKLFDIAADLDTPVSAFLKIESLGPRFLLESVEGGERLGRYSFIGFGDGLTMKSTPGGFAIDAESVDPSFLRAGRKALALTPQLEPRVEELPLSGGLVGVTSFETAHAIAGLTDEPAQACEFYAPRSLLVFDHVTHRIGLMHDGTERERQYLRREVVAALRGPLPNHTNGSSVDTPHTTMSDSDFMSSVDRAKDHIKAGDVYQLVLSMGFTGECDVDAFQVYRALRILNPSPYMYYFRTDDGAIAGSSPEALVRLSGRSAALRPIAGTRHRGEDEAEDLQLEQELLADPKEAAEHVMLVDLARNDVGRVSVPGSVNVDPYRIIERYSHVMHIVSGVSGILKPEKDAFDLFASCFPAGTVAGAPKRRALELIRELEPTTRGFYAGTVGYFGQSNRMDQAIAIRTIQIAEGKYRYQAGAGIVADSQPHSELAEVKAKAAILGAALKLAQEGL